VSCASHLLFQPNATVANAMQPVLNAFRRSHHVIGVHLRGSDHEMALRQKVSGRRLGLEMGHRGHCLEPEGIEWAMASCTTAAALRWPKLNVSVYVAGDSSSTINYLRQGLQQTWPCNRVGLLTSDGEPYHTGRPISMPDGSDPFVKVLVDFFLMDHVEHFFSNCEFLPCFDGGLPVSLWRLHLKTDGVWTNLMHTTSKQRCRNTFAGNIWLRRFHFHAQSPSLHDCELYDIDRGQRSSRPPRSISAQAKRAALLVGRIIARALATFHLVS